jgi:cellobiose-specific phosphotransferase system component IIA
MSRQNKKPSSWRGEAKPSLEEAIRPSLEEAKPLLEEARPSLEEAKHSTKPSLEEAKPSLEEARPSLEEAKHSKKPSLEEVKMKENLRWKKQINPRRKIVEANITIFCFPIMMTAPRSALISSLI